MDNTGFRFSPAVHKGFARFYEHGEGFYPFKSLAAAKAKYGAGLHDGRFEDPAVQYIQAYFCQRRGKAACECAYVLGGTRGLHTGRTNLAGGRGGGGGL
jgi:hypothetical protein